MKIFILFLMIFCHIVDDFYLQPGTLNLLKQKTWWENNASEPLYRHDYIVALIIHGFSWSFLMMLPLTIYTLINYGIWYPVICIANALSHVFIDHLKANMKLINLVTDQTAHLLQIFVTWLGLIIA